MSNPRLFGEAAFGQFEDARHVCYGDRENGFWQRSQPRLVKPS